MVYLEWLGILGIEIIKFCLIGMGLSLYEIANKILKERNPAECKRLGRSRKINFKEDEWENERERIYKEVLLDKFSVEKNKKKILSTGSRNFVEASPYDTIWGIGMRENDKGVDNPLNWRGLNLLGKVLDEVRDELRK